MIDKLSSTAVIKESFEQLIDKKEFIKSLADMFFLKPNSIRNHWFSGSYSIPEQYRAAVIAMLIEKIQEQIKTQNRILDTVVI